MDISPKLFYIFIVFLSIILGYNLHSLILQSLGLKDYVIRELEYDKLGSYVFNTVKSLSYEKYDIQKSIKTLENGVSFEEEDKRERAVAIELMLTKIDTIEEMQIRLLRSIPPE